MVIKLYLVTCYAENKPRERKTLPTWTDSTEESLQNLTVTRRIKKALCFTQTYGLLRSKE